jgi:hypothetical protein
VETKATDEIMKDYIQFKNENEKLAESLSVKEGNVNVTETERRGGYKNNQYSSHAITNLTDGGKVNLKGKLK